MKNIKTGIQTKADLERVVGTGLGTTKTVGPLLLDYYWFENAYYSNERSKILSQIKRAFQKSIKAYKFSKWFRVVDAQHVLEPLSVQGSMRNQLGGRFNFGRLNTTRFTPFGALYAASNYKTAMAEKFSWPLKSKKMIIKDEFLGSVVSHMAVEVKGFLACVVDVSDVDFLRDFTECMKTIRPPDKKTYPFYNKYRFKNLSHTTKPRSLQAELLRFDWKSVPVLTGIPAMSQVFGHLAYLSGVQGILYKSKYTRCSCMAIFPHSFTDAQTRIEAVGKFSPRSITQLRPK